MEFYWLLSPVYPLSWVVIIYSILYSIFKHKSFTVLTITLVGYFYLTLILPSPDSAFIYIYTHTETQRHTDTACFQTHELCFFKLKLLVTDTVCIGQSRHSPQIKKCWRLPNNNIEEMSITKMVFLNVQENVIEYMKTGPIIYLNNSLDSSESSINAATSAFLGHTCKSI